MNNLDYVSVAMEIAREAGELLLHHFEKRVAIEYKGAFNLVTVADRSSEKLIVERLQSRFPSHSILGEEGANVQGSSDYVWHIDPLDGTTNFAHGFPFFAVSMGLWRGAEPVAGVVYNPLNKEMFSAEKDAGAYLNHQRIRVSPARKLEESLIGTGFASANRHRDVNVYFFHQVSMLSHGIRRAGSAALDLCSVAGGRLEGFWEFDLKPWDVAAGLLLVTEAGGTYGDMKGGPYELGGKTLTASNGAIHQEMLDLFADVDAGKYRVPMPPVSW